MIDMKKLILLIASILLSSSVMSAQYDFSRSVDPQGDSILFQKMRSRMDVIRQERPTVALVLSGGGAKGAAHVGVIRYLESMGIPVDMVMGTSMGGLIGGLYACGNTPDEMDAILRSLDWGLILSDQIGSQYRSYSQRKYKEKYLFSIPFLYSTESMFAKKDDHQNSVLNGIIDTDKSLHFGQNGELTDMDLKDNLFGSLPAGYIFGQNVNNLFSSLTVNYQDSIDFCDLPIPFFCVAADLATGKAKLWHEGKINTALRSTMSIPGIFAPVRDNGMVLVDGGIRNNFPTDVAKEMGADIIIGVELSDATMTYSDIYNLADMVWKIIDVLGADSFTKNVNLPDVKIKPDLAGYNMLSFDPESIDTIISRGYEAACAKSEEIAALKKRIGPVNIQLNNKKSVNTANDDVTISEIMFTGLTEIETNYLLDKIGLKAGDIVGKEEIESAVATLFGTGSFESVTYELLGDETPYTLNFNCARGPVHQVGIGLRLDNVTTLSALVNVGLNAHKVSGHSLDLTTRISSNPYFYGHYAFKAPKAPTFNVDFNNAFTVVNLNARGITPHLNLTYWDLSQRIYLSDLNWMNSSLQAGLGNNYVNIKRILTEDNDLEYVPEDLLNDYMSLFVNVSRESYDDGYFPSKGFKGSLSYKYTFKGMLEKIDPVHAIQGHASGVIPMGERFAFIPSVDARFLMGDYVPFILRNIAGGNMTGRYAEQQIAFSGINYASAMKDKLIIAKANLRTRLTKNNYLTGIVGVLKQSDDFSTDLLYTGPTIVGTALEYGYDSIIGPIKVNVNWSTYSKCLSAYVSVGYDF